jgi:hypothetical protein
MAARHSDVQSQGIILAVVIIMAMVIEKTDCVKEERKSTRLLSVPSPSSWFDFSGVPAGFAEGISSMFKQPNDRMSLAVFQTAAEQDGSHG